VQITLLQAGSGVENVAGSFGNIWITVGSLRKKADGNARIQFTCSKTNAIAVQSQMKR
jgi:hypothetical protein